MKKPIVIALTAFLLALLSISSIPAQASRNRFKAQVNYLAANPQPIPAFGEAAFFPEQDPEPTASATPTPDPAIEKANKEKLIAEAEKAASDARKAASEAETAAIAARVANMRAKLGLPPTNGEASAAPTPPSGNITSTQGGKFIETQILADTSARQATRQLVQQLCGSVPSLPAPNPTPTPIKALVAKPMKVLVVNNSNDRSSVERYRAILAQLKFLHEEYDRLIKQAKNLRENLRESAEGPEFAAPLLIPAATEIVKNAAALINLFRTDTEFQDQAVVVSARTIVTLLTNDLLNLDTNQCKVASVFHPAVYPISISDNAQNGPLISAYRVLLKDVSDGDGEVKLDDDKVSELTRKVAKLKEEIGELKEKIAAEEKKAKEIPAKNKKKKEEAAKSIEEMKESMAAKEADVELMEIKISQVRQAAASIKAFKESLADMFKMLTSVDEATKVPVLVNVIRAERLSQILADDHSYVLDLEVKASGTNRIRRNIFWNAKIDHSAGVSIDANLYSSKDQLVFGTVEPFYVQFTNSNDIRRHSGFGRLSDFHR